MPDTTQQVNRQLQATRGLSRKALVAGRSALLATAYEVELRATVAMMTTADHRRKQWNPTTSLYGL